MTARAVKPWQRAAVLLARVHQVIGWAGVAGLALIATAAAVMSLTWSTHHAWLDAQAAKSSTAAPVLRAVPVTAAAAATAPALVAPDLPQAGDIPLLLTQMKQAAVANGLEWRAADYRVTPATPTQPASLEVRCSLRGPYPKLRSMLAQLIGSVPAFSVREFSASRPNADTPVIEAKLVLAVFLQDGGTSLATQAKVTP